MLMPDPKRIYLALGATDMRKSINGLSMIVQESEIGELFEGSMFVFCNRGRNIIKIIYWDHNGFCLWQKRLEEHRFKWPCREEEVREIEPEALQWLLSGLDIRQAHERLSYEVVY